MRRVFLFLMLLASLASASSAQRPQYGKMSPLLRQLSRQGTSPKRASSLQAQQHVCMFAKVTDTQVLSDHGCRLLTQVGNVCIVDAPISELGALSLDSRVLRMEARYGNSLTNDQMADHLNAHPAYAGQNLPQAYTGRGVVVGVMDVGFDLTHPTFYSRDTTQYRIQRLWDMITQDTVGSSLYVGRDYIGREALLKLGHSRDGLDQPHGTHTTGTAAGSGYQSPYQGMAPESDICLVANAVSDDIVYIDSADIYKYTFATDALGFKYLFDYAQSVGKPCVASFSEGSPQDLWGYDKLYYEMLGNLTGPGRIIVSSAGNLGHKKTWFRKSAGQLSAGAFLAVYSKKMMLTFKSADDYQLRFVRYGEQYDTLSVNMSEVYQQPDSVYTSSLKYDDPLLTLTVEAYPSCNDSSEVCCDVTVETFGNVGIDCPLSVEVVGLEADVEYFYVNGNLTTNSLNPSLNAGENRYSILSPSSAPSVISVGSTSYRDSIYNYCGEWKKDWLGSGGVRVEFSSIGPSFDGRLKPEVMAPGNNIISSYSSFYLENHPDKNDVKWDVERFDFGGRTYPWNSNSGTSMACPAVAGAIALWLQAKPDLTPEQVMDVISHTSRHYDESMPWPNNEYGYGEIDVYRGLLYILGVDRIKHISQQHTAACITFSGDVLTVTLPDPLATSCRLRLFTVGGRLQRDVRLPAGQSVYHFTLGSLPSGLYALQLDGPATVKGSTLIRKDK